mmetsp:Transcript_37452/g.43119  ORF Transcript_37452/g.43119 Transcript_37452/m.43119 type:complete len:305 (-) Transcript_37452:106-1020(-)
MRQSKSIVNVKDGAAIRRRALAILEDDEGVDTIEDDNTIEMPSCININEQMLHHKQQHALLSPSRSKAMRRASVTLISKQPQQSSNTISKPAYAHVDVDSCSSYDGSSTDSSREVSDKVQQRKSHTKRSRSRNNHATKSKKEEENNNTNINRNNSSSVNVNVKASVRFAEYDQINYVPHINDISQEELDSRWMNEEEYNSIRERSLRLVEMIEDPKKRYPISADIMMVNKHLIYIRGLSEMTTQYVYERDVLQRSLQTAIFQLQQQQREDFGVVDPHAIRQVSRTYSNQSYKSARYVGVMDGVK